MSERAKISVSVITYNQQETIAQTLDSILSQKGDFDLELVIGEDCSPDGTYAICADYAQRYPDVVKLLPNTKNLGITANYFRTLQACTGELISGIAGDDYYCDDHALEKQMLYLQSHPEVGVMAANGYRYYVRRNIRKEGLNKPETAEICRAKEYYFSKKYNGGVYYMPPGSMFRKSLLQYIDFEEIIRRKLPVEDYPTQAIWSQHTKFACLPDLLVTYRVYEESATFVTVDSPKYTAYYRGMAETRRYLNELFPDDACFTEEELLELVFYKEFLLYLHQMEYKKAKQLIAEASANIPNSEKVKQAKRFSKTRLHFIAAHYIKDRGYRKDLKKRT